MLLVTICCTEVKAQDTTKFRADSLVRDTVIKPGNMGDDSLFHGTPHSGRTHYATQSGIEENPQRLYPQDTSLYRIHYQDPILFPGNHYTGLSNNGSPSAPLFFNPERKPGFDFGLHQWDIYRYNADYIKYYTTRRPMTDINYVQGPHEYQYLNVIHTQNIKRNWNVALNFSKLNSTGFYNHEDASLYSAALTTWYRSLSRRYMVMGSGIWNSERFQENGGLLSHAEFENAAGNRTGVGFNLNYAYQQAKNQNYRLSQYFYLGNAELRKFHDTDSVATRLYHPRVYLSHTLNYSDQKYLYYDSAQDLSYFRDSFMGPLITREYFRARIISNEFSIGTIIPESRESAPNILFKGYLRHDFIRVWEPLLDSNKQNLTVGGRLGLTAPFKINFEGDYVLLGYNAFDYKLGAEIALPFKLAGKPQEVRIFAKSQQYEQSYLDYITISNHFRWQNDFLKTKLYEAGIGMKSDSAGFALTAKYDIVTDLVTNGFTGMPFQLNKTIHYVSMNASKNFKIWHFHFNNDVLLQNVLQGSGYIRLPNLSWRSSLYYEGNFFNNKLVAAMGVDVRYASSYMANNYMPGSSRFYLQDSIQTGNYPFLDAWVAGQISQFRLFIKMEHLNMNLSGPKYYTAANYPFYPRTVVRLGLRWTFYN